MPHLYLLTIIYLFLYTLVLSIATKHSSSNNNYNYSSIKTFKTMRRKKGEHAEKPEFARVVED